MLLKRTNTVFSEGEIEFNVDRNGHDIDSSSLESNFFECQLTCDANILCEMFLYSEQDQLCYQKGFSALSASPTYFQYAHMCLWDCQVFVDQCKLQNYFFRK